MANPFYNCEPIRQAAKQSALTTRQLAAIIGVSHATIAKLLNGKLTDPQLSTLMKMTRGLGVKLSDVLYDAPDPVPEGLTLYF